MNKTSFRFRMHLPWVGLCWVLPDPGFILDLSGVTDVYPCQMEVAFMCEIEEWKASYLKRAFSEDIPVFRDMRELGSGKAYELRSKRTQRVPKARHWL